MNVPDRQEELNMNHRRPRNIQTRDVILQYMLSFAREQGRQPSVREIGKAAGLLSTSTTAGYLKRMVSEGLLTRGTGAKRNYFISQSTLNRMRIAG